MFLDSSVLSTRTMTLVSQVGLGPAGGELVGVHAQRVHGDARDVAAAADLLGAPVHGGAQDLGAAVAERVGPALAVEPGVIGAEYSLEYLAPRLVGEYPVVLRRRPRGVREMRDPHAGTQVSEHPRDERQVIVLHYRPDGALAAGRAGIGGQRLGECGVVRPEGVPLGQEAGAELRPVRRVVEEMV